MAASDLSPPAAFSKDQPRSLHTSSLQERMNTNAGFSSPAVRLPSTPKKPTDVREEIIIGNSNVIRFLITQRGYLIKHFVSGLLGGGGNKANQSESRGPRWEEAARDRSGKPCWGPRPHSFQGSLRELISRQHLERCLVKAKA